MKSRNRQDIFSLGNILFVLLWAMYMALMLLLFHRQSVHYAGNYESDISPYILYMQGIYVGYEYPYPIMFWLGKLFNFFLNPEMSMAFSITLLNGLTPIFLKYYIDKYLKKEEVLDAKRAVLSSILVFLLLFVSMLFWEDGVSYRYKGVFTPNPFHNATYLAARGFAILSFFLFVEICENVQKEIDRKKYIFFGISLLLTTMTKPSFTLGFVAMAGVVLLYKIIKLRMFEWKKILALFACFLPTFIDLLYQYKDVFIGTNGLGEETGIGIGMLLAWHTASDNVLVAILLGLAFPMLVLVCNLKLLKRDSTVSLSWAYMLVNMVLMILLYEKGYRIGHMNFSWGYMYGMFFVYVSSALILFKNTIKRRQNIGLLAIQWLFFVGHLICGLMYFSGIMNGGTFV